MIRLTPPFATLLELSQFPHTIPPPARNSSAGAPVALDTALLYVLQFATRAQIAVDAYGSALRAAACHNCNDIAERLGELSRGSFYGTPVPSDDGYPDGC